LSEILDPRDPRPKARRALRGWLAFQKSYALAPVDGVTRLLAEGPPPPLPATPALDQAVEALAHHRVRALPFTSPAYPEGLRRLSDAAPLLLVRGDPSVLAAACVSIVGSRAATVYGLDVARRLAGDLARAGVVVVSGLARGIDAAAHRGALEAGGCTVAFQACGPDRVYPAAHRSLAEQIAERGAVVSELPLGTPPRAPYFPLRNRLISAASVALVVVEARERSGSLVTARHAADQGVEVLAVPGPITAPTSAGPNRLISEGARPLLSPDDVLEAAGPGRLPAQPAELPRASPAAADAGAVLEALGPGPLSRDELGRALGWEPGKLAAALLELELSKRVAEDRDGRLCTVGAGWGP